VTARVIVVGAAVIERDERLLVTRRLAGTHLGGAWEFPGGKCEQGESLADCVRRELREELDVEIVVGPELLATRHDYGDRVIELHFVRCALRGEPRPLIGQEMRWLRHEELDAREFPPADAELIALLRHPPQ
jgi:8-oxo-dGTP diphosphatase